jgi:hypothetical protein
MPINITSDISGEVELVGRLFQSPILLSQIFDGTPQYFSGSIIQCQEILTITTTITDEKLVDVDDRYWNQHKYLGTWQILPPVGEIALDYNESGYLLGLDQKIVRYSNYVITANPQVPIAIGEIGQIDNCSFETLAVVIAIPGGSSLEYQRPVRSEGLYSMRHTLSRLPLEDRAFSPRIPGIGLYLNPGVEGVSLNYSCRAINNVYSGASQFTFEPCTIGPVQAACDTEYANFINQLAATGGFYSSLAQCELAASNKPPVNGVNFVCTPRQFVCSTDENYTQDGWQISNIPV